jgi:hypothetical protein
VWVHCARLGLGGHEDAPVEGFEQLAAIDRFGEHRLRDDPDSADVILFTQCHMLPVDWRLTAIRDHPLTKRNWPKVMVYDARDRTWCGFPGVYVSMSARAFDHRYQRAWGYLPVPQVVPSVKPDLLFSFIGSASDRCRTPLFDLRHSDGVVEEVRRFTFYDPSSPNFEERRARFRDVLSRSRFVLCPRGRGTSSIRLYEVLGAGRVPVIIADDWVAPSGPNWEAFSIRWPEGRVEGLVEMLEERERDWPRMSAAAMAAHREFFAQEAFFHRIVELCRDLQKSSTTQSFPRSGIRNRAFLAVGADVARWRTTSSVRRAGKRMLRRLGVT